ncbi:DNA integrity scanning diadenylate cyclase DisA [Mesoaciditoga sp.]
MDYDEILNMLTLVSPGTALRNAIDDIMRADNGAIIFFVQNPSEYVKNGIIQPGFELNCPFTANKLYELAKMDGAIVISEDLKTIWYANSHLVPDSTIPSDETGTRHKTAERIARQTDKFVLCISQRRKVITLYRGTWKHMLNDVSFVVMQMNQGLRAIERYRSNFDKGISDIDIQEIEGRVTLFDVVEVIERGIAILQISKELNFYLAELGEAGTLAKVHLNELLYDVENIIKLLIMDYASDEAIGEEHEPGDVFTKLMGYKGDSNFIAKTLGYELQEAQLFELEIQPRGYRLLRNIPRIPMSVAKNVIKRFRNLSGILNASFDELVKVEGIGEKRAQSIITGISSLKHRANLK